MSLCKYWNVWMMNLRWRGKPIPALYYSFENTKEPQGLMSPFDGRIAINSTYAYSGGIWCIPGIFGTETSDWSSTAQSLIVQWRIFVLKKSLRLLQSCDFIGHRIYLFILILATRPKRRSLWIINAHFRHPSVNIVSLDNLVTRSRIQDHTQRCFSLSHASVL